MPQQKQIQITPHQYQTSYQKPQVLLQQPMSQSRYLPIQKLNP